MSVVQDENFQRGILRYMLEDYTFCQKSCSYLTEDFFTGELSWFFRKIKEHLKITNSTMLKDDLSLEIKRHGKDADQFEKQRDAILKTDFTFDKVKRELTGFLRANLFISAYKESSSLFNTGNEQDAFEVTKRKVDDLLKVDFNDSRVTKFGNHESVCDIASTQHLNAIPTGIHYIDQALGGGLLPQTWTTFLGGSNVGKSMLCPNLAYHAAKAGKKVFVTVHEDEENPTQIRYLSRFSGVALNVLLSQRRSEWTAEIARKVKEADDLLKKHVRLQFMYGEDCFVENVVEAVRLQKLEWDVDLFLCDYGQCLKSKRYKELADKYGLQEFIYSELKQACLEMSIAGAGGAQTNRLGHKINKAGTSHLRMTDVGDSWGICKKSSNVITMNRSDEDVQNHRIVFLLDKSRSGRCPVATECKTDFAHSVTHVEFDENNEVNQQEIQVETEKTNR